MKLMRLFSLAAIMAVALSAQAGGKGQPLSSYENVSLMTKSKNAAEAAIILGATRRDWTAEVVSPELVRCKINVRNKHKVVVDVPHTEKSFSIRYVSSENMNYDEGSKTIHRNYNRWVANLAKAIQEAAAVAAVQSTNNKTANE